MKIVSAAEMRDIDRDTSASFAVPSISLMENAGSAVARFIESDYPQAHRVGVICGKGNNGGDGFVVARKLLEAGRDLRVLLLCDPKELHGDAAIMFQKMEDIFKSRSIAPTVVPDARALNSTSSSKVSSDIFSADLMVDAILGTGFRPPMSDLYAAAIGKMNAAPVPIVAVDIPSGADADSVQSKKIGVSAEARAQIGRAHV
jgi:NAD(P)H-hydrate epimerase